MSKARVLLKPSLLTTCLTTRATTFFSSVSQQLRSFSHQTEMDPSDSERYCYDPVLRWNPEVEDYFTKAYGPDHFARISKALTRPSSYSCIRVNTVKTTSDAVIEKLTKILNDSDEGLKLVQPDGSSPITKCQIPGLDYVVFVNGSGPHRIQYDFGLENPPKEVLVSRKCAEAVLRGAQVYVPGVLACTAHVENGDAVAVCVAIEQPGDEGDWSVNMTRGTTLQGLPTDPYYRERSGLYIGMGTTMLSSWAKAKKGKMKNQTVAVKIISKAKMTSALSIEDVRREVKLLKALSGHRQMVKFYDVYEDADNVFVVMELCEGGELLDRILARGGRYPEVDAKRILVQILSATAFFHLQGVVHRDLKPENFLFTSRNEDAILKVIDFGLSDFIRYDQRLNDVVGSAYYVAPEVLHRSYSTEADMWSIGVISYILLCGSRPFYGRTESAIFRCVLRANPNFEDMPWPSISPTGKDFVKRLLNKDHRKRMTAAQALAHPWLRDENPGLLLDFSVYKLVRSYIRASPFRRSALKALSKAIPDEELVFLKAQFMLLDPKDGGLSLNCFTTALTRYATDAMMESRLPDILNTMQPLAQKKLDFDEFCAAAVSVYQLEALEEWEQVVTSAFEHFEQEGNRIISVQELAGEMSLGPSAYPLLKDWIRSSDGKLSFLGYAKFLHGVTVRSSSSRPR